MVFDDRKEYIFAKNIKQNKENKYEKMVETGNHPKQRGVTEKPNE